MRHLVWVREALRAGEAQRLRSQARLSLSEVGRTLGVSGTTVARWERGQRTPSEADALRYAAVLRTISRQVSR